MNDWYPEAVRMYGPDWKQGYGSARRNSVAGAMCHSADGYEGGLWDVLLNGDTSWQFSVLKNGSVLQHYPLSAVCWHAGTRWHNQELVGIEHEGIAGEPLTAAQLDSSVRLVRWIAKEAGFTPSREYASKTLWEHRDVYRTDCPSGRIPWDAYLIPRNAEVYIPPEEEVRIRELDQGESIAAIEKVAASLGMALNDQNLLTVVEVVEGSPKPIPAGGHAYLFTTKD